MKRLGQTFPLRTNILAALILTTIALCRPAYAERFCSVTFNMKAGMISDATVGQSSSSSAKAPAVWIGGGGLAVLTDPDGEKFTHQFVISAEVFRDGSGQGQAQFVFTQQFSQKWGAVPGVDLMHLQGEVDRGSVASNGAITLSGPFVETDYSRKDGIVYREDSRETGAIPLKVVIEGPPASKQFTLSWCSFIPPGGQGAFSVQVTHGTLEVRYAKQH